MKELDLVAENDVFEALHDDLRTKYGPEAWVVISAGKLQGVFEAFPDAAVLAAREFSDQPVLVRQVDSGPAHVPYVLMRA